MGDEGVKAAPMDEAGKARLAKVMAEARQHAEKQNVSSAARERELDTLWRSPRQLCLSGAVFFALQECGVGTGMVRLAIALAFYMFVCAPIVFVLFGTRTQRVGSFADRFRWVKNRRADQDVGDYPIWLAQQSKCD